MYSFAFSECVSQNERETLVMPTSVTIRCVSHSIRSHLDRNSYRYSFYTTRQHTFFLFFVLVQNDELLLDCYLISVSYSRSYSAACF